MTWFLFEIIGDRVVFRGHTETIYLVDKPNHYWLHHSTIEKLMDLMHEQPKTVDVGFGILSTAAQPRKNYMALAIEFLKENGSEAHG